MVFIVCDIFLVTMTTFCCKHSKIKFFPRINVLCFVFQLLSAVANDLDYMLTDLYDSPPTTLNR